MRTTEAGEIAVDADNEARHKSGSYCTPEVLVALTFNRAVGPLVDDKIVQFRAKADAVAGDRRPKAEKLAALERHDPDTAMLSLKICDPAMGADVRQAETILGHGLTHRESLKPKVFLQKRILHFTFT